MVTVYLVAMHSQFESAQYHSPQKMQTAFTLLILLVCSSYAVFTKFYFIHFIFYTATTLVFVLCIAEASRKHLEIKLLM